MLHETFELLVVLLGLLGLHFSQFDVVADFGVDAFAVELKRRTGLTLPSLSPPLACVAFLDYFVRHVHRPVLLGPLVGEAVPGLVHLFVLPCVLQVSEVGRNGGGILRSDRLPVLPAWNGRQLILQAAHAAQSITTVRQLPCPFLWAAHQRRAHHRLLLQHRHALPYLPLPSCFDMLINHYCYNWIWPTKSTISDKQFVMIIILNSVRYSY